MVTKNKISMELKISINKIFVLLIVFTSCVNIKEERRNSCILDGHEYKIWRFNKENSKSYYIRFYFDEEGRCEKLSSPDSSLKYTKFPIESDGFYGIKREWTLNEDTLHCLGDIYLIIKLKNDTVFLKSVINEERSYLIDIGLPPK